MTESTYDRIRKQECEGCRRYLSKMPTGSNYAGWHVDPSQHEAALRFLPCTAPSREAWSALRAALKEDPNTR